MMLLRAFVRDTRAASAAEFALVVPLMLLFLFGIIAIGQFAWTVNKVGKAVQVGARYAVVTDTVPLGLRTYSYAISGGVTQGTVVTQAQFPGIYCTGTASTATCTWKGTAPTGFPTTTSATAFKAMVDRMKQIAPEIGYANVRIDYDWSGLGFAGDPNGPDVAPLTKVTVSGLPAFYLFGANITLPAISYSLPMEDGSGSVSS